MNDKQQLLREATKGLGGANRRAWSVFMRGAEVIARVEKDVLDTNGITLDELHVLRQLFEARGERLNMGDLSEAVETTTGLTRTAVTRLVGRLEKKGLVEKYQPTGGKKEDRRTRMTMLTQVGGRTLVRSLRTYTESVGRNFSSFLSNAEAGTLADIIGKMLEVAPAPTSAKIPK